MTGRRKEVHQLSRAAPRYDPLDGEDGDLASHRLPRFVVVALLGLAGVATVVWFGYERSVYRGNGEIAVIGPPPGPVRTRPEEPGGTIQPYTGLTIYELPKPPEQEAESSHIAPVSSSETALASANPTSGISQEIQVNPATQSSQSAEPPEYLQIGAYPTQESAEKAFRQFRISHGDLAGDLLPDIKKADLGGKGIWYRLRIGPFAGKAAAMENCVKMKKRGVTCLIAAR